MGLYMPRLKRDRESSHLILCRPLLLLLISSYITFKTCCVTGENKSEENELTKSNTHTQNETNQEKILSYVHRKIFIPITKKLEIKY